MSSTPYANIELEFRPPWLLMALFVAWLMGMIASLAQLDWPVGVRAALAAVILITGGQGLAAIATGLMSGAVQRAIWSADGRWRLVNRAGRAWETRLHSSTRCWSRLGFLVWDDGSNRQRAIVSRSSVGAEAFRRMRVRLRYELPCDRPPTH